MDTAEICWGSSAAGRQIPSMSSGSKGQSFLDEVRKVTGRLSAESTKDNNNLKSVYERLTLASRDVLERLNAGQANITREEWTGLCKELKDAGVITQADFDYTRADLRLIPLGYHDGAGNEVIYEHAPGMAEKLKLVGKLLDGLEHSPLEAVMTRLNRESWQGDPLAYLDEWISTLNGSKDELARARAEDGSAKYHDFSPITDQIRACQKVSELVKKLSRI